MLKLLLGKIGCNRASGRSVITLLLLFFLFSSASAQFALPGRLPARIAFSQQASPHFKVVYPEELSQLPSQLLQWLEQAYLLDTPALIRPLRPVSVWVNPYEIRSNGRVVWAPRRIELFSTPPQSQEPGSWISHLAVHEFRHVVQMENLNRGPIRLLSLLTGQQATGLAASLLPLWYLEGEAVAAETAFFPSARGVLPSFARVERTAWLSEHPKPPGYFASMLGSYRVGTPGPYAMGYSMVTAIGHSFGATPLAEAARFTALRPYLLTPFSRGLRQSTGLSAPQWHAEVGRRIRETSPLPPDSAFTPFVRKNRRTHNSYTHFVSPLWALDSLIVVQRHGIEHLREFMILESDGSFRSLLKPSPSGGERNSAGGSLLAFTEFLTHPRWEGKTLSVVALYDFHLQKKQRLLHPFPLFSPILSSDGSRLAAVETDADNLHTLVVFSLPEGSVSGRFPAPHREQIQFPVWYADERYLAAILNDDRGARVARLDPESGQWETLFNLGFKRITDLASQGFSLFFTADFGEVTNICLYKQGWRGFRQLTRSRFGAAFPMPDPSGKRLLYADYTPLGFDIAQIDLDERVLPFADTLSEGVFPVPRSLGQPILPESPVQLSPSRPYHKAHHLFNLHSWAPFYYDYHELDTDDPSIQPGFVMVSQNLTGSLTSMVGASFNTDPVFHTRFTYRGWFPVVEGEFDAGGYQQHSRVPQSDIPERGTRYRLSSRIYIPLLFPLGRGAFQPVPSAEMVYANDLLRLRDGTFHEGVSYVKGSMQATYFRYASQAHLAPPFGISARVRWLDAPFMREGVGTLWALDSRLWLPGMAHLHSTQLTFGWQRQSINSSLFASEIDFPRGYHPYPSVGLTRFLAEYAFPWAYPDWEVGAFLFVKRLRSSLFADFGRNEGFTFGSLSFKEQHMASVGA
ncbi:MAG: hypothetical protein AB7C90_07070, partial [Bacteroidales bacterium]